MRLNIQVDDTRQELGRRISNEHSGRQVLHNACVRIGNMNVERYVSFGEERILCRDHLGQVRQASALSFYWAS